VIFSWENALFTYIGELFALNNVLTGWQPTQDGLWTIVFFLFLFFQKEVARGREQTRVLSISFIFSLSPLCRLATAAPRSGPLFA
jgi:hypothetical protein